MVLTVMGFIEYPMTFCIFGPTVFVKWVQVISVFVSMHGLRTVVTISLTIVFDVFASCIFDDKAVS